MASPIVLEATQVRKPPFLRGAVSFTLREGERVCLYGHSGSGKTTAIRALLGATRHRGECIWHVHRASVGYAAQQPRLIPRASVLQQLLWSAQLHGVSLSTHGSRVNELLDRWGLQAHRHKKVHRLSPGEQVRLELCCAWAVVGRLLVVDGLIEMLDECTRMMFWEEVDARCARREMGFLYATHSAREAELADRILLLHEGRVLASDTPEHLRALAEVEPIQLQTPFNSSNFGYSASSEPHSDVLLQAESGQTMSVIIRRKPSLEDVLNALKRRGGAS